MVGSEEIHLVSDLHGFHDDTSAVGEGCLRDLTRVSVFIHDLADMLCQRCHEQGVAAHHERVLGIRSSLELLIELRRGRGCPFRERFSLPAVGEVGVEFRRSVQQHLDRLVSLQLGNELRDVPSHLRVGHRGTGFRISHENEGSGFSAQCVDVCAVAPFIPFGGCCEDDLSASEQELCQRPQREALRDQRDHLILLVPLL